MCADRHSMIPIALIGLALIVRLYPSIQRYQQPVKYLYDYLTDLS